MRTLAILALLALRAPAQEPPAEPAVAETTRLGDTGLEMVLPDGLVAGEPVLGTLFLAMGSEGDGFRENLNLTAGPKTPPATSDEELKNTLVAMLARVMSDYELVEHGRMEVGGASGWWFSGRFRQQGALCRNLQVLVPGEPCFWLTWTTAESAFAAREPQVRQRLGTLRKVGQAAVAKAVVRVDGKRLVLEDHGFSVVPPAGWQQGSGAIATGALLYVVGDPIDGFAPNLNVVPRAAAATLDPRSVRKELEAELPKLFDEVVVHECAARTVGGRKLVRARFGALHAGRKLEMLQFHVPGVPRAFVVTYTVPQAVAAASAAALDASAATIAVAPVPAKVPPEPKK